jgi:hypothetical protein
MSLKLDLCAAVLLISHELPAEAHDIYSHLMDRLGSSCCNEQDCRPAPYRVRPTGVQMFVEGKWIWVPDHTIQYRALPGDTGETDGGHWCGKFESGPGLRSGLCNLLCNPSAEPDSGFCASVCPP